MITAQFREAALYLIQQGYTIYNIGASTFYSVFEPKPHQWFNNAAMSPRMIIDHAELVREHEEYGVFIARSDIDMQ